MIARPDGARKRPLLRVALLAAALGAGAVSGVPAVGHAAETQEAAPPAEPEGYRSEPYRAPTPLTLKGAKVLSPQEAEALWRAKGAVFVDVLPRPPKPATLPEGTVWRDPPHDTIPGALWLPNVGFGAIDGATEIYLREGLKAASGGDLQRPLVIFCLKDCWMSWNAAKRAMALGYGAIAWFPTGLDGWKAEGLPVERVEPWLSRSGQ